MDVIKHSIKNPTGIRLIMAMTIICLISLRNTIDILIETSSIMRSIPTIVMLLLSAVILLLTLYRALKKPTEMHLYSGKIFLNGRTIQAKEIKILMKMGYFRPVIGLKPYGKMIVPIHMCFRFSKDEVRGIEDIVKWAEDNNVKVVNKSFVRWI